MSRWDLANAIRKFHIIIIMNVSVCSLAVIFSIKSKGVATKNTRCDLCEHTLCANVCNTFRHDHLMYAFIT